MWKTELWHKLYLLVINYPRVRYVIRLRAASCAWAESKHEEQSEAVRSLPDTNINQIGSSDHIWNKKNAVRETSSVQWKRFLGQHSLIPAGVVCTENSGRISFFYFTSFFPLTIYMPRGSELWASLSDVPAGKRRSKRPSVV